MLQYVLQRKKQEWAAYSFNYPLVVIVIMLIYKKFFKNVKLSKVLLEIGFVKLLMFRLFLNVIQCNTKVKNSFSVI